MKGNLRLFGCSKASIQVLANRGCFAGRLAFLGICVAIVGCSRDVRIIGEKLPSVQVKTVSHYGLTLDQHAGPEHVAYVALRAIREDVEAKAITDREKALGVQLDVAAANKLDERNNTTLSRDEFVYTVVRQWAPTVSHYVKDFEPDWEKAKGRLVRREVKDKSGVVAGEAEVLMEVNEPSGDPKARAVVVVWMAQDGGFWRVTHLGFDQGKRAIQVVEGG